MRMRFSGMYQMAGIFILVSFFILIVASFYIIKDKKLFVKMVPKYTYLNRGDGISPATRIFIKGIEVGYVTHIALSSKGMIRIRFEIYPRFLKQMRGQTYIKVASGSFIGGKQLEIVSEDGEDKPLYIREFIPSEDDENIKKQLAKGQLKDKGEDMNKKILAILDDVSVIVKNAKAMSMEIKKPDSDAQRMLVNIRRITQNVAQITEALAKSSPEMRKMVHDSQASVTNVKQMLQETKQGSMYKMIAPKAKIPDSSQRMQQIDTRDL